jgi:acyl-CoA synthetase
MERDGLTLGGGPPYFITSLLDHPDCTPAHQAHIKCLGLGGSTVPAAVTRRLSDLGIIVFRSYGSSEHPSITGSSLDAPGSKRLLTDGNPMPGVEIRLAPDGEVCSRGPDLCLGYLDDGYLTITDRKADVIIRGGENISAVEVEEVLLGMPGIAEAAVVAAPDADLVSGSPPCCGSNQGTRCPPKPRWSHFEGQGVARHKWPEVLLEVADYPLTASGKVQKRLVRSSIAVASG